MITKIQMNSSQIKLAMSWLPDGSYPYAYNTKLIWFKQNHGGIPVTNAIKITQTQFDQLNQLAD